MRHCIGSGLTYIPFTCYFIFSPLKKGFMVHMKTMNTFTCQVWLKLAQWSLWRRQKHEKFMDRRTTGDQKSSFDLSPRIEDLKKRKRTNGVISICIRLFFE